MSDEPNFGFEIPGGATEAHRKQFLEVYGSAMFEWAAIEEALGVWFGALTGLKDKMLRAVYYSGKNAGTRIDLVRSCLNASDVPPSYRAFLEAAIARVNQYKSYRNMLAHGSVVYDADHKRLLVRDSTSVKNPDLDDIDYASIPDMSTAEQNFRNLRNLLFTGAWRLMVRSSNPVYEELDEQLLRKVHELPKKAQLRELGQTPKSPQK